ncbi:MAG: flagellar motor protein MotA [Lysobacteraceae bacterium]|nr:MAG: flagellar motor protein MotA [Xanthomonadaceae bacterium]
MKLIPIAAALILSGASSFAQEAGEASSTPAAATAAQTAAQSAQEQARSLDAAYRKEYAFLEAERRSLQQRLDSARQSFAAAEQAARNELNTIEAEVVELTMEGDRVAEWVLESERQIDLNADAADVLEATFTQAATTLQDHGIDRLETNEYRDQSDADRIAELFALGRQVAEKLSSVRTEQGAFFLADGTEVEGEILRVGNVAAYGRSNRGGGILAPAGGGRFKIWPTAESSTADALFAGSKPAMVDMFLFESLANAVERPKEKTITSIIESGGAIGYVIVALGLVALLLVILRAIFLRRASSATESLSTEVCAQVQRGDVPAAIEICKKHPGATARVLAAALRNLDRDREHIEDIVSEAILHEQAHLNRFGAFILVLAAVAPLLGLLGTVTGMISTFDLITEFGTGDPKLLAGGIAIALVTTELGLIVAIPTLLIGNLLSGWAESIQTNMEKSALRLINIDQDRRITMRAAA